MVAGDDGQWLLDRLQHDDAEYLRELRAVETLSDVWAVHYERGPDEHMRWKEGGERGGSHVIETPHDLDARWSTKRSYEVEFSDKSGIIIAQLVVRQDEVELDESN